MIERLDTYLDDPARVLPTPNMANGSERQQRSERRHACVALLGAMVRYLDLASLRVGIPLADGGFMSLTLQFFAKHAGLSQRRTERAMRDLLTAGLVKAQSRCEKDEEGRYRGLAALRQLPQELFAAFGLGRWLGHERRRAVQRRYQAAAREAKAAAERMDAQQGVAQLKLALASVTRRRERSKADSPHKRRPFEASTSPPLDERIARRIGAIKLNHPDWTREQCIDAALREIASPKA
ncbi:hypothetical protein WT25_01825 [Burkholderia territorii]|nr:hypothetical protein WT25_01825 [Burkholderia territorii]